MAEPRPETRAPITSEAIANVGFRTSLRGFDITQVREYLRGIADHVRALQDHNDDLQRRLREAESRADHPVLDQAQLASALGDETARILQSAHEAAAEIRGRAQEHVERVVQQARDDGAKLTAEAANVLEVRRAAAEAEAAEILRVATEEAIRLTSEASTSATATVAEAEETAREAVEGAKAERNEVLSDVRRRRRIANTQIEQLRAGRERLLQAYEIVRATLDQVTTELNVADDEAQRGGRRSRTAHERRHRSEPGRRPRVDPHGRHRSEYIYTGRGGADLLRTNPEPSAPQRRQRRPSPGDGGSHADAHARSRTHAHSRTRARARARTRTRTSCVVCPRRPRANDTRSRSREVGGGTRTRTRTGAGARAAEGGAEAQADEGAPQCRGATRQGAARNVWRARGAPDPSSQAGAAGRAEPRARPIALGAGHAQRRLGARRRSRAPRHVRGHRRARARRRRRAGAAATGNAARRAAPHLVATVANDLALELVLPLRRRLDERLHEAAAVGDDQITASDRVSSAYREAKTQRAGRLAEDWLAAAWAVGVHAATPSGTPGTWASDPDHPCCTDCDDNGLAGGVPVGTAFPTGHLHPPAHPGCRCVIVPTA